MNNVELKIKKIIEQAVGESNIELHAGYNLYELGINSVLFIKIVVDIEQEFEIEFDNEDLDYSSFKTFGALVTFVEKMVQYKS